MDIFRYMDELTARLRDEFAGRLLFTGLQGSYRRGEAGPDSDIDAAVILDTVSAADLRRYRGILEYLPQTEKACGFISGAEELRNWPRYELFQFRSDTRAWHGCLDDLLPPLTAEDIRDGIAFSAAAIYHQTAHQYVHGPRENRTGGLKDLYKSSFFTLLAVQFLETGVYAGSRRELLGMLSGRNRAVLAAALSWDDLTAEREADPDRYFSQLLDWSGALVRSRGVPAGENSAG